MGYDFHDIKILIVEDNQPMVDLTSSILKTFGVGTISAARNGREGFEKFCEINHDIIIADWMMRPVDGIALTRLVRNDPNSPNPYVPIVLMTGFGDKERVLEARDSGVTEFLAKPFNTRDLYTRMVQIIEKPRQFVRCGTFFGPDRRRNRKGNYTGEPRRKTDVIAGKARPLDYEEHFSKS